MKIPTVLSFLYVGNLLRDAHCSPLPELFAAKSMEEVEALMSKTKQRPAHEVLRGRRRLQDGTLETSNHILADRFGGEAGFFHSVASGDPLADAVIIWTRYTPVNVDDEITLEFRMAAIDPNLEVNAHLDPTLNENIKRGKVTVTAASDFTAKIDVTGLPSNTQFVYVFSDGQQVSDIGLTKTAPAPRDEDPDLIYAFFSCSHFTNGFFHAYDVASTIQDLDLWIHVGDYYYEYGLFDTYAREAAEQRDQFVLPIWETIDLQDYRNRHSTHVAHDEGLRNLRRRAPMIATWDDHETTNDSYGNVNQGTGAENHQETCLANATSPDADKAAAQCDRPEGDAVERFTAAAQAYWEWMPIRYVEGTMGEIQTGTLTQIIEWGDLATIASFDTRMSFRTEESTGASAFATYAAVGAVNTNVSSYSDPSSDAYAAIQQIRESDRGSRLNESFSMLGDYFDTLEDVFEASKATGKPWQIWAANTMMGHYVLPDAAQFYLDAPEEVQAIIQTYFDAFMLSEAALTARLISALRVADIEWNLDDYGGFYAERAKITEMAKTSTNNMVVLGGDLHDAFAWVLVEGGEVEGAPVAINLGCPSVTSPGFKNAFLPVFSPILEAIGGEDVAIDIMNRGYARANPNLKFSDIGKKGFVAIKATMDTHTAEYIGFSPETLLTDFATARTDGAITAPFECQISLTTQSDVPGSLEPSETCSAIAFDNERPAVYDLPVPSLDNMPEGDALTGCGMIGCAFDASTEPTDSASTVTPTAPAPAPASSSTLSIGRSMGLVTGVLLLIVTLL